MTLELFTIVLDGMPFVTHHLPMLQRLNTDWHWTVVEGVANPVKDTSWCRYMYPRLSMDGTHEYLKSISNHPRVTHVFQDQWQGKTEMCNKAIEHIKEPCLLVQVDADELWESWQLMFAVEMFKANPDYNTGQVLCRYFLGNNVHITTINNYGNRKTEWKRFWRFKPGMKWKTHEPPVWENFTEKIISREQMAAKGIMFDHYAYATEAQLKLKEVFYGYGGALRGWRKLQENKNWPVKELREYLPWVDPGVSADLLFK